MARTTKRTLSKNRVELRFDIARLVKESEPDTRKRNAIMDFISNDNIKREFGFRATEAIIKRTLGGKDKNNNSFIEYKDSYKQSDTFKIFGKSSRVNLKLSGEMHASMRVLNTDPRGVTIGIDTPDQAGKAHGHIFGTFSKKGNRQLPVRDFFDLDKKAQFKILQGVIRNRIRTEVFVEALERFNPVFVASGSTAAAAVSSIEGQILFAEDFEDEF